MARPPFSNLFRARIWCPRPLPNCPVKAKSNYPPNFAGPRQWLSLAASFLAVPRRGQSVEGAIGGHHQSLAVLCLYRCRLLLAEVPKDTDRNAELKLRLRVKECGRRVRSVSLFPSSWSSNSHPLRIRKRVMQPQTDEQGRKRTCAWTVRGAVNKAMEGFVGGAAQGSAGCQKSWTAALILQSSGSGTYATNADCAEAARTGTTQSSARRGSKAAAEKHRVGPSRQTVAYQCPGPHSRKRGTFGLHRLFCRSWSVAHVLGP